MTRKNSRTQFGTKTKYIVGGLTALKSGPDKNDWAKVVSSVSQLQDGAIGLVTNSDKKIVLTRKSNDLNVDLDAKFVEDATRGGTSVQKLQNSNATISIVPGTGTGEGQNGIEEGTTEVFIAPGKYVEDIITTTPEQLLIVKGTGEGTIPLGTTVVDAAELVNSDGNLTIEAIPSNNPTVDVGTIDIKLSASFQEYLLTIVAGAAIDTINGDDYITVTTPENDPGTRNLSFSIDDITKLIPVTLPPGTPPSNDPPAPGGSWTQNTTTTINGTPTPITRTWNPNTNTWNPWVVVTPDDTLGEPCTIPPWWNVSVPLEYAYTVWGYHPDQNGVHGRNGTLAGGYAACVGGYSWTLGGPTLFYSGGQWWFYHILYTGHGTDGLGTDDRIPMSNLNMVDSANNGSGPPCGSAQLHICSIHTAGYDDVGGYGGYYTYACWGPGSAAKDGTYYAPFW